MMLTLYVGQAKPIGWQFVDSTFVNGADYEIYEDQNGQQWYVPLEQADCPYCDNGRVSEWDDLEDEMCLDCDGDGWMDMPVFEAAIRREDFNAYERQRTLLYRRYGRIPQHINDYWLA